MQITTKQVIMVADTPNKNGHIYPEDAIRKAVAKLKMPAYGQVGMPDLSHGCSMDINHISHTVDAVWVEDGKLMGSITVLDTPRGELLTNLLTEGVHIDFRIAGTADASVDENGHKVLTDLTILSINAVSDGA